MSRSVSFHHRHHRLVAALRPRRAIAYAIIAAIYYLAWGFVGVFGGTEVRHHLGVDVFGTWVHVVEGLILLAIWRAHRLGADARASGAGDARYSGFAWRSTRSTAITRSSALDLSTQARQAEPPQPVLDDR